MTDLMAVTSALSEEQRAEVVHRFTALNPRWRGARCEDILDVLDAGDACLGRLEPFFEAQPELAHIAGRYAALALIWSGAELTEPAMRELLARTDFLPHLKGGGLCPSDR